MTSNDFKFSTWDKLKSEGAKKALGVSDKSTHLAWELCEEMFNICEALRPCLALVLRTQQAPFKIC